jgi:hypothetical protein
MPIMRGACLLLLLGLGGSIFAAAPARAGSPVFVVPSRPDVPVIINGVDASWCVVDGDWGLERPGAVSPTVICPVLILPEGGAPKAYYPQTGEKPRVGRLEVQPPANRVLPKPAESFYRVWSAAPEHLPATEYPAYPHEYPGGYPSGYPSYPSYNPPPVVRSPRASTAHKSTAARKPSPAPAAPAPGVAPRAPARLEN